MKYQALDRESLEFISDSNLYLRLNFAISKTLTSLVGTPYLGPPVIAKKGIRKRYFSVPDLEQLGRGIGFDDSAMSETLAFHKRRLKWRWIAILFPYFLFALPASLAVVYGQSWLMKRLAIPPSTSSAAALAMTAITLLLAAFVAATAIKISTLLVDKFYADSLCISAVICLIIELSRDDALVHPAKKRELLFRINALARNTLLLALTFGNGETTKNWLREHFRHMESYVRDRERWAIAPQDTTLDDLRQDFYRLATVYITGNYGDFAWPEGKSEARAEETPRPSPTRRLLSSLPRFIVGVVLPLVGLAVIVLQPGSIELLGIEARVLSLIFIAWFLLALDSMLNLGIVAGIADLAKGMKELT